MKAPRRLTCVGLLCLAWLACAGQEHAQEVAQEVAQEFAQEIAQSPLSPEEANHWAWKRPARPALPEVKSAWVRNPIDAFVLAKLEAAGLKPALTASKEQLIRRVTFDLIGLPPTLEEIDAFVNDASAEAYERLIDRLLASPHYGERWGRHWLDLARFAESNGYEHDETRPDAWRYRDYVIRSFNADKPYDRFVNEQLAGDELAAAIGHQRSAINQKGEAHGQPAADLLIATGFNLLGPDMTDAAEQAQRRQNTLNDMTDTTGLVFLGLTITCARCHDHKFEPIPQADYYRLQAFFTPAVFRRDLPIAGKEQQAAHDAARKEYDALTQPLRDELKTLEAPYRSKLHAAKLAKLADEAQAAHQTPAEQRTPKQSELVEKTNRLLVINSQEIEKAFGDEDRARHKALSDQLKQFDARKPAPLPVAMGLKDGPAAKTFLLERGELGERANRGDEVQAGFPIVTLPGHRPIPAKTAPASDHTTGRRTALANWIASAENPLTARVFVNRLWQHHFGRGIVATPSDFGLRGARPTHPELLDWLSLEFMSPAQPQAAWCVKRMHKLMLMSATYQQSTKAATESRARDPENQLLGRMNRLRLEGEVIRDSLLAISGRLNPKMGGPGVFPPIPPEVLQGYKGWTASADPQDHVRRSVYIFARRNLRFPFLEAFDYPDSNLSCPKREQSTTAPQALALLNAGDVLEAARAFADRLAARAVNDEERVVLAYRLALGRRPSPLELKLSLDFLKDSPLAELCRALFNTNEFIYLD